MTAYIFEAIVYKIERLVYEFWDCSMSSVNEAHRMKMLCILCHRLQYHSEFFPSWESRLTIPHRLVYTVSTHRTHRHSRNGTNNGFRPPGTNNRLHMVHPIGGVLIPRLEKLNLLAMDRGRGRKTRIIITTTSMEKKRWSDACLFGNIHDGILEHQGARRNRRGHSNNAGAHQLLCLPRWSTTTRMFGVGTIVIPINGNGTTSCSSSCVEP